MMTRIRQAIQVGDLRGIDGLVREALDAGADPQEVLDTMVGAMNHIGERFEKNRLFIPEITICARTLQRGARVLKPFFAPDAFPQDATLVIGTVKGDMHDVGKNLVGMMADAAGYKVVDLGVDVSAEQFLTALREAPGFKAVSLSTLLSPALDSMEEIVRAVKKEFPDVPVLVGGSPVTVAFSEHIGADACTETLPEVVETLRRWSSERS